MVLKNISATALTVIFLLCNASTDVQSTDAPVNVTSTCGSFGLTNYQDGSWTVRLTATRGIDCDWSITARNGTRLRADFYKYSSGYGSTVSYLDPDGTLLYNTLVSTAPKYILSSGPRLKFRWQTGLLSSGDFDIRVTPFVETLDAACPNNNTKRIPISSFCDGNDDCGDKSDEICFDKCGISEVEPRLDITRYDSNSGRIVGGYEAVANSWPWQVGLGFKNSDSIICGGSLIAASYVITAAHCCDALVKGGSRAAAQVLIGAHRAENDGTKYDIDEIISHESYTGDKGVQILHDVCLLKLSKPVRMSKKAQLACLGTSATPKVGTSCYATGWGTTIQSGSQPDSLRQVTLQTSDTVACGSTYQLHITPEMLCAYTPSKDTCQGDSGGPLVCPSPKNSMKMELFGVVSYGYGCAQPDYPGVYMRTTSYIPWIAQQIYNRDYEGWTENTAATIRSWTFVSFIIIGVALRW